MATSAMAATSTLFSSFGLKTQLPLTPSFANNSLKFSSSYSVRGLHPIVLSKAFTTASPVPRDSLRLTVECVKGYKMKTHKASAKRFRVSGSGKRMRRRAGKQHLLRKKNTKRRLRLSKMMQVDRSDYNNVIGALPYLKVNRSN